MRAHDFGEGLCLLAPDAVASCGTAGGALVAANAVAPVRSSSQEELTWLAQAAYSRELCQSKGAASNLDTDVPLPTQRSVLGLKGKFFSSTQGNDGQVRFRVNRWALTRNLSIIAAVRAFAGQMGAMNA